MSEGHARLGPSNQRWPNCPGSVREEEAYEDTSSVAAISGTGSHLLLELCILNDRTALSYQGEVIGLNHDDSPMGWFVDNDRIDRVQIALDYIDTVVDRLHGEFPCDVVEVEAESKSNPGASFGRTDWWGTCDITITVTAGHLLKYCEVIDYKDGRMYVDVNNNTQLISYLWGKAGGHMSLDNAVITIIQPKIKKQPIRSQLIDNLELTKKAHSLNNAAQRTDVVDAELIAGAWCDKWCKHKQNCTTHGSKDDEVLVKMNGLIEKVSTDLQSMNSNDIAEILDAEEAFKDAFTKVKIEAERRIEAGGFVPGYFMGKGNKKQVWNEDEEIIAKRLKGMKVPKDSIFPSKLITPSQAGKLKFTEIQKNNLGKLISEVDGKTTLKKGKVNNTAEQMFPIEPVAISFL